MVELKALIGQVATGAELSRQEAAEAFDRMMSGEATPSQMGGLSMALRVRGETVEEITGAVAAMRAKMLPVKAPPEAIDVVGTGGDASGSYNISTCAAFIVAARACRSPSTAIARCRRARARPTCSTALGVKIDLAPEAIATCITDAGIGFMFAPAHHPAMKHVGPTRVELGTRTIFNLLGPVVQPGRRQAADGRRVLQAVGRAARARTERISAPSAPMSFTARMGSTRSRPPVRRASPRLRTARCSTFEITPEDVGIARVKPEALRGGDADDERRGAEEGSRGQEGAVPRRGDAQRRSGARRRGRGEGHQGGYDARRRNRSIPARPRAGLTG